jgi:hypothetical protein
MPKKILYIFKHGYYSKKILILIGLINAIIILFLCFKLVFSKSLQNPITAVTASEWHSKLLIE